MRGEGRSAALHLAVVREREPEVHEEHEADEESGRHPEGEDEHHPEQHVDTVARERHEVEPGNPEDRSGGSDHGHGRERIEQEEEERRRESAGQVGEEVAQVPESALHVRPEDPEHEHVPGEVQDPPVQEHVGEEGRCAGSDRHESPALRPSQVFGLPVQHEETGDVDRHVHANQHVVHPRPRSADGGSITDGQEHGSGSSPRRRRPRRRLLFGQRREDDVADFVGLVRPSRQALDPTFFERSLDRLPYARSGLGLAEVVEQHARSLDRGDRVRRVLPAVLRRRAVDRLEHATPGRGGCCRRPRCPCRPASSRRGR